MTMTEGVPKPVRVYSKKRVYEMLVEAQAHGSYAALLKREGIGPVKISGLEEIYYPADQVDRLIADILA